MEDEKAKTILREILDAAGRTGAHISVKELASKLGIPHEEADQLASELCVSGLAWGCIEPGAELVWQNHRIAVSAKGRQFLDGFPIPKPDMWTNAPAKE